MANSKTLYTVFTVLCVVCIIIAAFIEGIPEIVVILLGVVFGALGIFFLHKKKG